MNNNFYDSWWFNARVTTVLGVIIAILVIFPKIEAIDKEIADTIKENKTSVCTGDYRLECGIGGWSKSYYCRKVNNRSGGVVESYNPTSELPNEGYDDTCVFVKGKALSYKEIPLLKRTFETIKAIVFGNLIGNLVILTISLYVYGHYKFSGKTEYLQKIIIAAQYGIVVPWFLSVCIVAAYFLTIVIVILAIATLVSMVIAHI